MRVITQESLLDNIFTELHKIEIDRGSCHYGDYEKWCLSGKDVEQAINNLFLEDGVFKPTKDLIHFVSYSWDNVKNEGKECEGV